jgi:uncharacterized membrane protein
MIFSCMGWIYETIYCTIKRKRWENRGFLYGPVCPIYGAGAIACEMLVDLLNSPQYAFHYTWWQVFIVSFFGSIVLEYSTSWALEKLFHAYWWDYSQMPLNIKGRVCFPCSVGFGFAGILVVYAIVPFMEHLTGWMSPVQAEFFGLVFMALRMTSFVQNVQDGKYTPGTVIEGGKRAATAMLETGKEILEERERFSKERLEQAYASMGPGTRSALTRVEGFRTGRDEQPMENGAHYTKEAHMTRMNRALKQIKEKFTNK